MERKGPFANSYIYPTAALYFFLFSPTVEVDSSLNVNVFTARTSEGINTLCLPPSSGRRWSLHIICLPYQETNDRWL